LATQHAVLSLSLLASQQGSPRTISKKRRRPKPTPVSFPAFDSACIASLPHIKSEKGYLFTTNAKTHVSGYSRAKSMLDKAMLEIARAECGADVQIPRWTFHDLRRTAVSGMARLGISLPVIEKVVNHSSGSFTGVGVCQRHSFADEKRTALQAWANFVLSTVEKRPANVVPLRA
jgi:integrase